MKKIIKYTLIVFPEIIILMLVIILINIHPTKSVCGDGICNKAEIINGSSFCDIDCATQCIQGTGATEENIEESCSLGWNGTYLSLQSQGKIQTSWLSETTEIDFSNPTIQVIAKSLRRETPKETAKAIARWTYENIRYDSNNTYYDCRDEPASHIISRGYGVCSTMSKVNIALLRANGIPAYSVTGCFKWNDACRLKQTFFPALFPPKVPIKVDESGYAPTYGYLHNWVELPLYEDGNFEFVLLESTSGNLYENDCVNYRVYYISPTDTLACGLSQFDTNLEDCNTW